MKNRRRSRPPGWCLDRTLYQVNLRQFTQEGTLRAFRAHLPRLRDLGVGILWFMPIHPIGEVGRKGSLGSYYAVRDYRKVNPEHGTMRDFDRTVRAANEHGMEVILDWVPNHTAWDHPWIRKHPEWYRRDPDGRILPPVPDWTDVAQLDYGTESGIRETLPSRKTGTGGRGASAATRGTSGSGPKVPPHTRALWDEMQSCMEFWVRDHGVAGFRCDVAAFLPLRFWQETRIRLRRLREVFLLAEADGPGMHDDAFDATYGWTLQRGLEDVRRGHRIPHGLGDTPQERKPFRARELEALLRRDLRAYPADALRMQMTSNHDANSWTGSVFHRLGRDGAELGAVLSFVFPGIPLIYNGQEAGSKRRLAFFEKDEIPWPEESREHAFSRLYRELAAIRRESPLLRSGSEGAPIRFLKHDHDDVIAFVREDARGAIFGVFQLGADSATNDSEPSGRGRPVVLRPRCRFPLRLRFASGGSRGGVGEPSPDATGYGAVATVREIPPMSGPVEAFDADAERKRWRCAVWTS
ncbi:MAG: alpha-amylase family glycosyl hydrolase [Candidatus Eisenbacteria bacterium]